MIWVLASALMLTGCAALHHVQIGEIDNTQAGRFHPVEVKVSETGIDIEGATRIAKGMSRSAKQNRNVQALNDAISMFQMGPRTGNLVFNDTYAEKVLKRLRQTCPSGKITGITSIRESMTYPVVSGEIIKITAMCSGRMAK